MINISSYIILTTSPTPDGRQRKHVDHETRMGRTRSKGVGQVRSQIGVGYKIDKPYVGITVLDFDPT